MVLCILEIKKKEINLLNLIVSLRNRLKREENIKITRMTSSKSKNLVDHV